MVTKTTWAVRVAEGSRCAKAPGFAAQLASQIPPDQLVPETDAELMAEVRVVRSDTGLTATIAVIDRLLGEAAGSREIALPAADCEATADALSLVMAVLVEAGRGVPVAIKPSEPPPPPPLPPPKRQPQEPKRYAWLGPPPGYDLTVGVLGTWGLMPGFALGGTAELGVRVRDYWPFVVAATVFLPTETADGHARFRGGYASIESCPFHIEGAQLRLRACPALSVGLQRAEGRGFLETRSVRQPLVLAGAEFASDFRLLGPVTVGAVARLELPLLRQRFTYYAGDGSTPKLHQARPITISSFLTVGLRFR